MKHQRQIRRSRSHLANVFTALAISREVQVRTGLANATSPGDYARCAATIAINGSTQAFAPGMPDDKQATLDPTQGHERTH